MRKTILLLTLSVDFLILASCQHAVVRSASTPPILASGERDRGDRVEATGKHFAVATQGISATNAARAILAEGGNLIDAAVASSFVLAVERPHSTGLTGGGFMLYREASNGKIHAIDFRERAPLRATEKMFVTAQGVADPRLSRDSILSSGVPGMVAGLTEIHGRFGKLSLSKVLQPAIDLADRGFAVYPSLALALKSRADLVLSQAEGRKIFANKNGTILRENEILVQKDLAQTLRAIAKQGRKGFYGGVVGRKFLNFFKRQKGLISAADFAAYKVHWREPVRGTYRDYEIVSMPPPSSGGVHVIQFLNFLEQDFLAQKGFQSADSIHLAASSLQAAFADRAKYMGDPDFVKVPVTGLISKEYAQERRREVTLDKARSANEIAAGNPLPYESSETTHFSMIDAAGNMVSSTQTINGWMGSGWIVPGTGLVLNNEMDDFSAMEGAANMFGAVGGWQNAVQSQKTPLSSMAPTLVLKKHQPVLALGAPGGTRIISCVAQTILNVLEFRLPLYESIASVRYHHQWQPDVLQIDPPGPAPKDLQNLQEKGYKIEVSPVGCNVMAVAAESSPESAISTLRAVSDPRDIGTASAE
jgi:gamma-glutamyltranspeptidase/glutathione hydrolase